MFFVCYVMFNSFSIVFAKFSAITSFVKEMTKSTETLKKIDRFIGSRINKGQTIIFRKELMGDLKFYIKNEKK